ncbi:hypothetical protein B0H14DRAFT_3140021, partial [Mycena olivaceomarginata]
WDPELEPACDHPLAAVLNSTHTLRQLVSILSTFSEDHPVISQYQLFCEKHNPDDHGFAHHTRPRGCRWSSNPLSPRNSIRVGRGIRLERPDPPGYPQWVHLTSQSRLAQCVLFYVSRHRFRRTAAQGHIQHGHFHSQPKLILQRARHLRSYHSAAQIRAPLSITQHRYDSHFHHSDGRRGCRVPREEERQQRASREPATSETESQDRKWGGS